MIALDPQMQWVCAPGLVVLCADADTAENLVRRLSGEDISARIARPCRGWAGQWCGAPVLETGGLCGNCRVAAQADTELAAPWSEGSPDSTRFWTNAELDAWS